MRNALTASILVFTMSLTSFATTVQRLSLDEMVHAAHSIVHGRVRSSTPHWSTDHRLILTTTVIDVQETMKGQASRTIEVTTIGGKVGDLTLVVPGMPAFEAGEEAILFVETVGVVQTVVGLSQGKFAVRNGEVTNITSSTPAKMRLDDFKRQILSRLK